MNVYSHFMTNVTYSIQVTAGQQKAHMLLNILANFSTTL